MGVRFLSAAAYLAIKRVLRREASFVCGICRTPHESRGDAESCLDSCLEVYLAGVPVVPVREAGRTAIKCRFCGREFQDLQQAHACAADCRAKFLNIRQAEQATVLPLMSRKAPVGRGLVKVVYAPVRPSTVHAADPVADLVDADLSVSSSSPSAPASAAVESAAATAAAESAEPEVKKKDPKQPKFYRNGAKYVCSHCNEEVYTKVEATNCWDSHP